MTDTQSPPMIALVAGERSGDLLGASLIKAIHARWPNARFVGVGGQAMAEAGCELIADYEPLAITGIGEVLRHLPQLLLFRRRVVAALARRQPDVFVGIDAPDFNLSVEKRLKKRGIRTVHYVSPSIWAWREGRVKTIAKAADRVLALLPFEPALYRAHHVDAVFVGHPLADEIAHVPEQDEARQLLRLPEHARILALLPGSRRNEIERLAPVFLETVQRLTRYMTELIVTVPMATPALRARFETLHQQYAPDVTLRIVEGRSREVMAASDAVLLASGTAALEALFLRRPMVVAYKLSTLTRWIVRGFRLLKIDSVSLPNLLAGRAIVPEFLQERAQPDALAQALIPVLDDDSTRMLQLDAFARLIRQLDCGASARAAEAVMAMVEPVANAASLSE